MTKKEKKKAFGYIRVSTAMQVDGGYSLDDQENRIRQHAKDNDMTLVDIYRDEGKSGKNISGRPGFQKMLEEIRNGQKIDYVLVIRLSRFGRNASDVMTALKTLQSHGVALWCIEDMLDSSTKMGDAMLKMSSIFAEMERENIREQTRAGRYEKEAVDDKMAARHDLRDTIECVANDVSKVLKRLYQMSDEEKAVLYHQMFEHFELNPDANYRKGERVIKKAFLRVPITYGDESVDAFVPGDGSGNS